MKNTDEAVYFDLDGTLADWVEMYNRTCEMPLEEFSQLSKKEKHKMKEEIFGYDFFRNMLVIEKGLNMLREYQKTHEHIFILSAVGDSSHTDQIALAKTHWVRDFICPEIEVLFVDKVENKYKMKKAGFKKHTLIDDRTRATESWTENGGHAILFVE